MQDQMWEQKIQQVHCEPTCYMTTWLHSSPNDTHSNANEDVTATVNNNNNTNDNAGKNIKQAPVNFSANHPSPKNPQVFWEDPQAAKQSSMAKFDAVINHNNHIQQSQNTIDSMLILSAIASAPTHSHGHAPWPYKTTPHPPIPSYSSEGAIL